MDPNASILKFQKYPAMTGLAGNYFPCETESKREMRISSDPCLVDQVYFICDKLGLTLTLYCS